MMTSLNKAFLIGRLGADPDYRMTKANGTSVTNFKIATSEYASKDGKKEQITHWHTIVAWGRLADITNTYLKKGSLVLVEGKVVTRSYDKDGQKLYTTEIIANNVQFLDPKSNGNIPSKAEETIYEDIPF